MSWIPSDRLGQWLLLVSAVSVFNTAQCFIDPTAHFTRKVYTLGGDQGKKSVAVSNIASPTAYPFIR
jgi:hypothetical protein